MTANSLFDQTEIQTPVKLDKNSGAITREKPAVEMRFGKRYDRVENVIGNLAKDTATHCVSAGEWSTHDLLLHVLKQTGPAAVVLASWSLTKDPAVLLLKAIKAGEILSLHCLFDWRVRVQSREAVTMIKQQANAVGLSACHGKVTVIQNEQFNFSIVGSANYTNNPRIEASVITESKPIADFHKNWIMDCMNKCDPFDLD